MIPDLALHDGDYRQHDSTIAQINFWGSTEKAFIPIKDIKLQLIT